MQAPYKKAQWYCMEVDNNKHCIVKDKIMNPRIQCSCLYQRPLYMMCHRETTIFKNGVYFIIYLQFQFPLPIQATFW